MEKRLVLVAAAVMAVAATFASVPARAAGCDRACRIEAANRYLAALVSHDPSDVPLHPRVQRVENGSNSGDGAEDLRAGLQAPIMYVITGIRELRWFVDGDDVVSTYLLDTVTSPTYIVERFRVGDDGLIRDIRANFFIDIPGYVRGPESIASRPDGVVARFSAADHGPLGPVPIQEGDVGDASARARSACGRACVAGAAARYAGALVSHDARSVPLAQDVSMRVNRRTAGTGEGAVRAALREPRAIAQVRQLEVAVDGEHATLLYTLRTRAGAEIHGGTHLRVVGGRIVSIDAVCDANETCSG